MTARTASATGGVDIGTWTLSADAVAKAIQQQDSANVDASYLTAAEQGGECVVDLVFEDITLTSQMQRSHADVAALFQANFTVSVHVCEPVHFFMHFAGYTSYSACFAHVHACFDLAHQAVSTLGPGPRSRLFGPISNGDYFALDFSRGVVEVPADEAVSFANSSFRIEFWLFLKSLVDDEDEVDGKHASAQRITEHEAALQAAMAFAKQQEGDDYGDEVVFSCGVRNPAISASHSCISISLERGRTFMCLSLFNDDLKVLTSADDVGKWVYWSMSFDAESKVLVIMKDGEILGRRSVGSSLNRCFFLPQALACACMKCVATKRCQWPCSYYVLLNRMMLASPVAVFASVALRTV